MGTKENQWKKEETWRYQLRAGVTQTNRSITSVRSADWRLESRLTHHSPIKSGKSSSLNRWQRQVVCSGRHRHRKIRKERQSPALGRRMGDSEITVARDVLARQRHFDVPRCWVVSWCASGDFAGTAFAVTSSPSVTVRTAFCR